ncbi:MAG: hypothetical protein NTY01_00890 [Verrucomicrobia bacterium]|nr:hypothetical protein [Verrucomicrobiota bacterium]
MKPETTNTRWGRLAAHVQGMARCMLHGHFDRTGFFVAGIFRQITPLRGKKCRRC